MKAQESPQWIKLTQKSPHDGVGLLQGLRSVGWVKQQPVDDVDLFLVLLSDQTGKKTKTICRQNIMVTNGDRNERIKC